MSIASFREQFSRVGWGILVDDNEECSRGVLFARALSVTEPIVNQIFTIAGGIPSVAISRARAEAFLFEPMQAARQESARNDAAKKPSRSHTARSHTAQHNISSAYTVSVEAREGVTTGISIADRTRTISLLGATPPDPRSLVRPGHIFPLVVADGGVLVANKLPEGALDLVMQCGSGITPTSDAALVVESISPNGSWYTRAELDEISSRHGAPMITLSELVRHRLTTESLVSRVAVAQLPTSVAGDFTAIAFRSSISDGEHLALVKGEISPLTPTLVRVHSENTVSDLFGGTMDGRGRLHRALELIRERGSGVLVYLRKPAVGSLAQEISRMSSGEDAVRSAAVMREYGVGAQILRELGVRSIELLTSSPKQLSGLAPFGIEIVAQHPLFAVPSSAVSSTGSASEIR